MQIKRGDIFLVDLNPVIGSEQGNMRPVVIIQNNFGNQFSPTTIIAPITSKIFSKKFPTNVFLSKEESKLKNDSTILLNQIRVIDKKRIVKRLGSLDVSIMEEINFAIKISLGLN